jgi:hypothetical protein
MRSRDCVSVVLVSTLTLADDKAGPPLNVLASLGDINPPPVTTEPSIPPLLRAKIGAVHNSTSGYFGVEYTRKVLLSKGVSDD